MADVQFTVDTQFGTFEVSEGDVVTFPRGIPGFEQRRRFVLLSNESLAPLRCLQAVDGGDAFLAVDPRAVLPDYECALGSDQRTQLDAEAETPLVWLVLVSLGGEDVPTANLRAPVVINPVSMLGGQFVINEDLPVRHELAA